MRSSDNLNRNTRPVNCSEKSTDASRSGVRIRPRSSPIGSPGRRPIARGFGRRSAAARMALVVLAVSCFAALVGIAAGRLLLATSPTSLLAP